MQDIGKTIFFGAILVLLGAFLTFGSKIPFIAKLPGDIFIKKDGFTFYFPLATSILLSILVTIIINIF